MPQVRVGLYEGLFLLNQTNTPDLNAGVEHVKSILDRAGAEILVLRKWDERKLAYPIRGQKRGAYLLAYFKARATQVAGIDRDCNLSEQILRSLVIAADHVGEVELELAKKEVPASVEAKLRGPDERSKAPATGATPGAAAGTTAPAAAATPGAATPAAAVEAPAKAKTADIA